jgi:hypothetical protein
MKSIYKNVYWHEKNRRWVGKVKINYVSHHIGCFASEIDAHNAVVAFKIASHMLDANGNMPALIDAFEYESGNLIAKFNSSSLKRGDVAGVVCNPHGYVKVGHGGKLHNAHHVVWVMFNGDIPIGMEIDHINGNRSDNRIENLRIVTRTENMRNRKLPITNTTGEIGVKRRRSGSYSATVGGQYIGTFNTFEEAREARRAAANAAGYHKNHGRI